jgi:hypothetical protein
MPVKRCQLLAKLIFSLSFGNTAGNDLTQPEAEVMMEGLVVLKEIELLHTHLGRFDTGVYRAQGLDIFWRALNSGGYHRQVTAYKGVPCGRVSVCHAPGKLFFGLPTAMGYGAGLRKEVVCADKRHKRPPEKQIHIIYHILRQK